MISFRPLLRTALQWCKAFAPTDIFMLNQVPLEVDPASPYASRSTNVIRAFTKPTLIAIVDHIKEFRIHV